MDRVRERGGPKANAKGLLVQNGYSQSRALLQQATVSSTMANAVSIEVSIGSARRFYDLSYFDYQPCAPHIVAEARTQVTEAIIAELVEPLLLS